MPQRPTAVMQLVSAGPVRGLLDGKDLTGPFDHLLTTSHAPGDALPASQLLPEGLATQVAEYLIDHRGVRAPGR
jgi:hypothetical protein